MTPVEERRQLAREAFWDGTCQHLDGAECNVGIESAIETALRVQITPEVLRAAQDATECDPAECDPCIEKALIAALGLLGFEVVQ